MKTGFSAYKEYLDKRVKCYPVIHGMISFYKGLFDIWDEALPDNLSPLLFLERFSRRLHLLDVGKIGDVDFKNSADTAKKIFTLMEELKGEKMMGMAGLTVKEIINFIRESLSREDRFKNAPLKWILKPSFRYTMEAFNLSMGNGDEGKYLWGLGRCPICYSPPGMALIGRMTEEGAEQRYMSCCFCGYQWLFDRFACPGCGNDKPEKFGFFVGESGCDQGTRAVSCEECKTYIKTLFITCRENSKTLRDLDIDIEDVATIPLDIIADQRGYTALCQQTTKN